MTTNQELAVLGLATVEDTRRAAMPAAVALRGRTGKILGHRQNFTGEGSASDIKAALKAAGYKGKDLNNRTRDVLKGERDLREQVGLAWVQCQLQAGFVPNTGTVRKNTATMTFVKVAKEPVVAAAPAVVTLDAAFVALKAAGYSDAEIAEIKALKA